MHFPDLALCTYGHNAKSPEAWNVPLLAIGWLERGQTFSEGEAEEKVIDRARKIQGQTFGRISGYRGLHRCDLCEPEEAGFGIEDSHVNLFIPGNDCVYMASGGLVHYMEEHSYLPPEEFVSALLSCPLPSTPEYEEKLTSSNRDERPEILETHEERHTRRMKERGRTDH